MTPYEPETEPLAGVPFPKIVCKCIRCGRLVTAESSVHRGAGQKCWEHIRGRSSYARLEAQGQMNWISEASQ